jgi:CheY-like chemotaxis protein
VFANLLNNAAKFSGPGRRIGITARIVDGEVELVVRDEGVGMPPELLARFFDMFSQGNHSLDRAQGGLGIGLTLVKSLVELHGGRVSAHSEGAGRGSEFVVRLPLAAPGQAVVPGNEPDRAPRLAQRVLVVDDNRDAADSLAILLGKLDVDCRAAYDGESGLAAIRGFRPAFVLLDIGMPGMDGYELLRRVRQESELDPVRFVALTGWGQEDDRRRSLAAGCVGHLVKPVGLGALTSLLSTPPPSPHDGARDR